MPVSKNSSVAIIGGGPAGLMAAETLLTAGMTVNLFDAMPTLGRKFLMAGKGGLNISHAEAHAEFILRYGQQSHLLQPSLDAFPSAAVRDWMQGLGIDSFVGSSGRVFPSTMKAAPLLRSWLHRLRRQGLRVHARHRWQGWDADGALLFQTPEGEYRYQTAAVILALGGGSWPQLGSDGSWVALLRQRGIAVETLKPANCGFDTGWSDHFRQRFAGNPVKPAAATLPDQAWRTGEFIVTDSGIEGGLVYHFSAALRETIETQGSAILQIDLLPQWTAEKVAAEVARPRGSRSLSSHLQSRLGLKGVKMGLLRECLAPEIFNNAAQLAAAIKSLPLRLIAPRPLEEAISSAGGVDFIGLDPHFMLRDLPGIFCAGEMLDWEAPTGGYLLTACLATGRTAGLGAEQWLRH